MIVDAALARGLIDAQFPQWSHLPVRPVSDQGWDNTTFRLGEQMLVRLPTAAEYALAVAKEHRWLPQLAPRLPLPVPAPVAKGDPGPGYPHPWSVYTWLEGEQVDPRTLTDHTTFATDLAGFLHALQNIDPEGGPAPRTHNWFRGGPLSTWDDRMAGALPNLPDRVDSARLEQIWRHTIQVPWDGQPLWFHGDIAPGNLLLRQGRPRAVIDFGTCGVGDPAYDLAVAWTVLSGHSREIFRAVLDVDPATWVRGRDWALWKTVVDYPGVEDGSPDQQRAEEVLAEIAADHST